MEYSTALFSFSILPRQCCLLQRVSMATAILVGDPSLHDHDALESATDNDTDLKDYFSEYDDIQSGKADTDVEEETLKTPDG